MRWSIEELFNDMATVSNRDRRFFYRLWHFPKSLYRQIRCLFYWLFTGHGYSTYWWLDAYFTKTISMKLKLFRSNKKYLTGYPGYDEANSEEKWYAIIDEIIEGFDAHQMILDGKDNPTVPFDSTMFSYTSKEWDLYYEAQSDWERELIKKFDRAKYLFTKFYSNFWD